MIARPLSEWHEDIGPALWWKFPIDEPPYVGTPKDLGWDIGWKEWTLGTFGGWPGYHTHWTPIEIPEEPN